jgi:predicted ATP-dependent endonuclease of OLD family
MQEIMEAEGGATLKELAKEISDELARLVPAGSVILEPQQPAIRLPSLGVTLRIAEGGLETAVGRQGHGFQRALLIAIVQQLAGTRTTEADGAGEVVGEQRPALFLALEEPELYQHPVQARHFASSLAALASGESVQVGYATHSEHFVDPARYERLRLFRRRSNSQWPIGDVTQATITGVTQRLQGAIGANEVATRIRITLRRQIAEAVFARAVLIVEGHTDAGFFHGIADRDGGLDADGISVVVAGGKTNLLIPRAILEELAVPTFVVFDGDASQAKPHTPSDNEKLLRGLGATPEAYPPTHVEEKFASFHDDLEAETSSWDGYSQQHDIVRAELGDWRGKSEDVNRSAAAATPAEPPKIFTDIIHNLRALV